MALADPAPDAPAGPPAASAPHAIAPLIAMLAQRRKLLVLGYVALLAAVSTALILCGATIFSELPHSLVGDAAWAPSFDAGSILLVAIFLVLEAVFLLGLGRIRALPRRKPAAAAITVIGAFTLALLTIGLVTASLELCDRWGGLNPVRPDGWFGVDGISSTTGYAIIGTIWLVWALVILVRVRRTDGYRAAKEIIALLLAGSWIEFVLALAVDTAVRNRGRSCICAAGSWVALMVCVPLLLWSIGPAIFLLYFHEKDAAASDPARLMRILRGKTRWIRPKKDAGA